MKIVDVCAFYTPHGGGVRTYVDRKLAAATARGHELVVIAPGAEDAVERRGPSASVRWLRSPRFPLDRNYRYFADRAQLHRLLDAEAPDVVEVSSPWRSASMVADWRGVALRSLVAHADPLSAYAYRWFEGVADRPTIDRGFDWYWRHLRRLDRCFDVVMSASESLSTRLSAGGLRKVMTNPMGVEPHLFSPTRRNPALRTRLLQACGLPPTALLLLGVGRHAPEKRWPMVTRAVLAAGLEIPVGLVIVGDGHARRKVVAATAGNPHIHLLAPIAERALLAALLASGDALIHGCEAETFCFVAAEAAASGLPLIVPDQGGASDLARGRHDIRYRAGDANSAAAAILRCRDIITPADQGPSPSPPRTIDDHFDQLFAAYDLLSSSREDQVA